MSDDECDALIRDTLRPMLGHDVDAPGWIEPMERALIRAGMRAGIERAAEVCDDRAIVYDGLEDAASTRYFADKMRGAREGSEQCAAAIRALIPSATKEVG